MENHTIFKFGKPSISMGHLYHGYVSHNQIVCKSSSVQLGYFFLFSRLPDVGDVDSTQANRTPTLLHPDLLAADLNVHLKKKSTI